MLQITWHMLQLHIGTNHMFKREIDINFKNERGKFSLNFTNKHEIPGLSHLLTSSQRTHKGKNYTKTIN